jgi:AcrR family transcriptional regulator
MADVSLPASSRAPDSAYQRDHLWQALRDRNDCSLVLLKGGQIGGLRLKPVITDWLGRAFLITEGASTRARVAEIVQRWAASGMLRELLRQIRYPNFPKAIVRRAQTLVESGEPVRDARWLIEISKVNPDDPVCQMLRFLLNYLRRVSQQLLLKRFMSRMELLRGYNLTLEEAAALLGSADLQEVPEQDFVKKVVVGCTNPYLAHSGSLRGILARTRQGNSVLQRALACGAQLGLKDTRLVASLANAVHASSAAELTTEVNLLRSQDVRTFFAAVVEERPG